jgi:hypothetical protein
MQVRVAMTAPLHPFPPGVLTVREHERSKPSRLSAIAPSLKTQIPRMRRTCAYLLLEGSSWVGSTARSGTSALVSRSRRRAVPPREPVPGTATVRPGPQARNLHTVSTRSAHVSHGTGLLLTLTRQSDPGVKYGVRHDGMPPLGVTFAGSPVDSSWGGWIHDHSGRGSCRLAFSPTKR